MKVLIKRSCYITIALYFFLFSLELSARASDGEEDWDEDSDLIIEIETITQQGYAGTTITDLYDVEILTHESSYAARRIKDVQIHKYQSIQRSLFLYGTADGTMLEKLTGYRLQEGMFSDSYRIAGNYTANTQQNSSTVSLILILVLGTLTGMLLAIALNKRKSRK